MGPDGALWFTEDESDRIGRITTAGKIRELPLPNTSGRGIARGFDGALWFSENTPGRIGRITPAGTPGAEIRSAALFAVPVRPSL
jgi:virginiamycin B lyase